MSDLKQAIVLRDDLDISKGKAISQACHASLKAYKKSDSELRSEWERRGAKKVVLGSGDRKVRDLYEEAERNKIPASIIKDAGHTEVEPGTVTALGIGPAEHDKIDKITGELKLIR